MIAVVLLAATFAAGWHEAYWWLPLPTAFSIALAALERWALNRRVKREWDEDGLSPSMRAVWLKEAIGSVGCVATLSVAVFFLANAMRDWIG